MRSFQATVELFRAYIQQQHWSIIQEKPIKNALQLLVTDGQNQTPVVCFTTGNVLVQGTASPLKTQLQTWWNLHKIPLRALGVRDSKTISDTAILPLAEEIKRLCSPRHFHILAYQPAEYNQLYQAVRNLNLLLAKAHAQTIQALWRETGCHYALVDQFGPEALVVQALQALGCQMTLEQRTHAEDDVAVAAASILARAAFLHDLERLSRAVQAELPKGASDSTVLIGRSLVAKWGKDILESVAKLHFQTTQQIQ